MHIIKSLLSFFKANVIDPSRHNRIPPQEYIEQQNRIRAEPLPLLRNQIPHDNQAADRRPCQGQQNDQQFCPDGKEIV